VKRRRDAAAELQMCGFRLQAEDHVQPRPPIPES
jgi:hypothetical protein